MNVGSLNYIALQKNKKEVKDQTFKQLLTPVTRSLNWDLNTKEATALIQVEVTAGHGTK